MTRINADYPVEQLYDQHLMAEYRELTMVPASLRRSLRTKSVSDVLAKVPKQFCLNKGHVTFWYNKLDFLILRYAKLQQELRRRGFNLTADRSHNCNGFDKCFYTGYNMSNADLQVISERINARVAQKPTFYRKTSYKKG
jgi:deoxyribonuclease (pyrimidine dimer)